MLEGCINDGFVEGTDTVLNVGDWLRCCDAFVYLLRPRLPVYAPCLPFGLTCDDRVMLHIAGPLSENW